MEDSRSLELKEDEKIGVTFLRGPAFDLRLWLARGGLGGIDTLFHTADGKQKKFTTPLTRLRGRQPYLFTMTWDLDTGVLRTYFNGIWQGDIGHWGGQSAQLVLREDIPTTLADSFDNNEDLRIRIGQWSISDTIKDDATIAADHLLATIPPLVDEGRRVFDGPLDLSAWHLETLYEVDFSKPGKIVRESALFEDGKRVRRPPADAAWVLEGPEDLVLEERKDGLFIETPHPQDRRAGHAVLWSTRHFPDDILIEYSFTPESDTRGLNICFLAARGPDGSDIFEPGLPLRNAIFTEYINSAISNYHISTWATDDQNLRRTSNLRKNPGFHLAATGNDVIGGSGPGPHTVRILKSGGKIRMEANGTLCLAFDDDGKSLGPTLEEGAIGLRFMAHTRQVTLHSFKVSRLIEAKDSGQ